MRTLKEQFARYMAKARELEPDYVLPIPESDLEHIFYGGATFLMLELKDSWHMTPELHKDLMDMIPKGYK